MKKEIVCKFPTWIGVMNVIFVGLISIYLISINYKKLPYLMYMVLSGYVKYSFIPAIFSCVLMVLVDRKISTINFLVNILYIVMYIGGYFFLRYISMGV